MSIIVALLLTIDSPMNLCADPDARIPENMRMLESGEPCRSFRKPLPSETPASSLKRYYSKPISSQLKTKISYFYGRLAVDPQSSIYRWLPQTHPEYICVWINSKNRYGGYVGWEMQLFRIEKDGSIESGLHVKDRVAKIVPSTTPEICETLGHDPTLPP